MIAYLLSLLTPGTEPEPHLSEVRRRIHRLQHAKPAPGEPTIQPPFMTQPVNRLREDEVEATRG